MSDSPKKRKTVGVALGGGAARGIAHIGVLKALQNFQIPIDFVAGVSAGAVVGGFFSAGFELEIMEAKVKELTWSDFASFHLSKIGMMSSKPIEMFMQKYLGRITFEQLKIPFSVLATNLQSGEGEIFNDPKMEISQAIRASASFPGVLDPTLINGKLYCDGGATENVPVSVVKAMGADVIIAIDVIPNIPLNRQPAHMMAIVDRGLDILLTNMSKYTNKQADIVLSPLTEYFASRHFRHAEQMIEMGTKVVIENIDSIKKVIS